MSLPPPTPPPAPRRVFPRPSRDGLDPGRAAREAAARRERAIERHSQPTALMVTVETDASPGTAHTIASETGCASAGGATQGGRLGTELTMELGVAERFTAELSRRGYQAWLNHLGPR